MAARPGEEMVATLFADVHYFYSPATSPGAPRHHRFDKGSYVYLFEDAGSRRARVEVANHPGTDAQDAFEGFLDSATLRYDYKQHCVVTLIAGAPPNPPDPSLWHLPTYDPRNENIYHYPLHSFDVYFWTRADALQFVNGARRVLPAGQCEIANEPAPQQPPQKQYPQPPQQHNEMSAVVQQLENVAITGSVPPGGVPPPPPLPAQSTGDYAPMAYNPAAPAAPETFRHREKTPPPPQDPSTDPRFVAAAYEHSQATGQPFSPAPFSPYFPAHQQPLASPAFAPPPGQPGGQPLASPGFAPPGHAQFQRANTLPVPGSPGLFPGATGMASQTAAPATPAALSAPPAPQTTAAPPQPVAQGQYGVHNQVYVPEGSGSSSSSIKKESRGRLEENAGRLEKGMTGMLKKFEKKFG